MCKFAMVGPYKSHYACFNCRKSFKFRFENDVVETKERNFLCPNCQNQTVSMGWCLEIPRQQNVRQWKRLEILAKNKIYFRNGCCSGPGYRPRTLQAVPEFLGISSDKKSRKNFFKKYR